MAIANHCARARPQDHQYLSPGIVPWTVALRVIALIPWLGSCKSGCNGAIPATQNHSGCEHVAAIGLTWLTCGFTRIARAQHYLAVAFIVEEIVYIVPRTGMAQTCKRTEMLQKPP